MKLDKFAAAAKGAPETADSDAQARAERRRRPLHQAFLAEVYPTWQGPMVALSKVAGVTRVAHVIEHSFPPARNADEVKVDIAAGEGRALDWLVAETIEVQTALGVTASISYALAGDPNDCVMSRIVSSADKEREIDVSRVRTWTGTLEALMDRALEDVPIAADMVDDVLLAVLERRNARLADEKRQAEEAERQRVEEEAARVAAAAAEKRRKEEAALEESRRLEAEAKEREAGAAAVVPMPAAPPPAEPGTRRRRK